MPRRTIWSVLAAALLCLVMLPVTALAADNDTVYVGGVELTGSTSNPAYAMTDNSGNVSTDYATAENYNIKWDGNTLTLKGAYITKEVSTPGLSSPVEGAAIGVYNQSGDANLTITLEGTNTIKDVSSAIWVFAPSGSASLTITGDGILSASSGFNPGITVQSNDGNAALTIQNAEVTATSAHVYGVQVRSGAQKSASLTVEGGSLTATGNGATFAAIMMQFGSSISGSGTPTVTVSNNAIVRASGNAGGITSNSSAEVHTAAGTGESGGIVFDNDTGTVYGDVTLQEDITISEGESLTIPDGASLTIPNDKKLTVNGGALTGDVTGTVIYKVTGVSLNMTELTLTEGDSETLTASIAPTDATKQKVTWNSSAPAVATVDANGNVTALDAGTAVITVTTEDGNKTATCTVTVEHDPAGAWSSDGDGHWHACAACGDGLDYAGHTRTVENEKKATCTEEGYTGDTVCSVCGYVIEKGETIPAAGHAWGAWDATEPATCEKDGVETRACEACGEEEIRSVPALGHDFENGTCAVCGAKDEGYVAPEEPKDPEQTPEPSDPEPTVPETGDATASFSLALGVLGAAALGAGAIARRRG